MPGAKKGSGSRHRRVIALAPDAPGTEQDAAVRRFLGVLAESRAGGDLRRIAIRSIAKRYLNGGERLVLHVSTEIRPVPGSRPHFRTLRLPGDARLDEISEAVAGYRHLVATAEGVSDGEVMLVQQRIVHPPNKSSLFITVVCAVARDGAG